MEIKALRGMNDVGAPEIYLWRDIEKKARSLYELFGFHEVRTPILESTALFKRGVGETTDIVEKEMYTFNDRNGDSLSLRPEGTASIVRATIEHQWLNISSVQKIYYFGPMFRHERPQKGRYRQHFQFGLEIFGVEGPWADVEIMAIQHRLFSELGLDKSLELYISSLGCNDCRSAYRAELVRLLTPRKSELCEDCQRRLERNPLRILDCKVENDRKIAATMPSMMDYLDEPCRLHFDGVKKGLDSLNIPYKLDAKTVRGIDYYTRTSFEFKSNLLGAQSTLCGGGRYDNLIEQLGGKPCPGVGCGMGMERLSLLLSEKVQSLIPKPDVFIITPDASTKVEAYRLSYELRQNGIHAEIELEDRSMKAQMKKADKTGARFSGILGGDEVAQQFITLKDMTKGEQSKVLLKDLVGHLKKVLE